ncbi:MAG: hypothetical protein GX621_10545 [Pirellulaceae bacterium]|nr:hypothetical protein [Pirellulaceae bacterium]
MATIIYGVAGEGSGHSSRAREMAGHLLDRGHAVKLVSYDRGYRNLKDDFDVVEVEGLCIASQDNKVSAVKTFTENLKRLPDGFRSLRRLRQVFKDEPPECVITDFEPMTAYLANHFSLPLVTIDNQHRMRYVEYECPPGLAAEAQVTKTIIRAMVPKPDVSLVTAFHFGATTNNRTFLFPPIVRREVLDRPPVHGPSILVYLTGGNESFLDELKHFARESFVVYGYDRDEQVGNVTFRPFSRDGFIDDLASAKAVAATAGFTLISEALALKKPYLAMPMQGQFEQELNAFQLEQAGYGARMPEVQRETIAEFLYRLPEYEQSLRDYDCAGNQAIKDKLDELLADDCALARAFHENRQ